MDTSSHMMHAEGSVNSVSSHEDTRQYENRRIIVLYKNLLKFNNVTKASNFGDTFHKSVERTFTWPFQVSGTWSVYKQLMPILRPRILSCMASANEVVSTRTLDTKAKIREMQQLEKDIQNFIANETPYQRLQRTYTEDVNIGKPSVQVERCRTLVKLVFCGLFWIGGFKGLLDGHREYMAHSKFIMFGSKFTAYKRRNLHTMKCFLREGIRFSFRGGILSCSVFAFYQCLEIYMNKSTPWTLAVACGVGASLAKIGLGPKGMFSNFVIASGLGLCGGFVTWGVSKLTGETQEDLNYEAVKASFVARRQFQKIENSPLIEYHEEVDEIE